MDNYYVCKRCNEIYMPPDDDVDCKYCDGTSCVFLYQAKNKTDALEQKDKQFGLTEAKAAKSLRIIIEKYSKK